MAILSALFVISYVSLDPAAQIQKSRDTQRRSDINEISKALEIYFHDTGCFPIKSAFDSLWGLEWQENQMILMKKVPLGPHCTTIDCNNYVYLTSSDSCPKWFTIIGKREFDSTGAVTDCPLELLDNCVPLGYNDSNYKICKYGGTINCSAISTFSLD